MYISACTCAWVYIHILYQAEKAGSRDGVGRVDYNTMEYVFKSTKDGSETRTKLTKGESGYCMAGDVMTQVSNLLLETSTHQFLPTLTTFGADTYAARRCWKPMSTYI